MASERYNVNLILEMFQLRNLEWTFFFKDHHPYFLFPFTLTYFDILLEDEAAASESIFCMQRNASSGSPPHAIFFT